jgi:signal peptidase I
VAALREILETLVFALLVFMLIRAIWQPFRVEGSSMEPNIHDGQYLVINQIVYSQAWPVEMIKKAARETGLGIQIVDRLFHDPQRGDIIVFIPPNNPGRDKDYIKRIIGLPGEKVEVRQGVVYINDRPLLEPYVKNDGVCTHRCFMPPQLVGVDEYFVLGDNRNNSEDSRSWGMLPRANIVGNAWFSYWPLKRIGPVPHSVPILK